MSKLDHPAYGLSLSKPHTKTKITFEQAQEFLRDYPLFVSKDYAFGDAEYWWGIPDANDNVDPVAGAYKSSRILDIWINDYEFTTQLTIDQKLNLLTQYKTISIGRNDSGDN
jgi:hypothetical protein